MNKKQIALKIIEKLIALDIDFNYTCQTILANQPIMIGSDDLGDDIVITHGNVYFDVLDLSYTINNEEDLKGIFLWDE